jgi:hypothetical protein
MFRSRAPRGKNPAFPVSTFGLTILNGSNIQDNSLGLPQPHGIAEPAPQLPFTSGECKASSANRFNSLPLLRKCRSILR